MVDGCAPHHIVTTLLPRIRRDWRDVVVETTDRGRNIDTNTRREFEGRTIYPRAINPSRWSGTREPVKIDDGQHFIESDSRGVLGAVRLTPGLVFFKQPRSEAYRRIGQPVRQC